VDLEDQQRFQLILFATFGGDVQVWLHCERCSWQSQIDDPLTLAELNQRADEHTEVCR
jgi:hypothetical protein